MWFCYREHHIWQVAPTNNAGWHKSFLAPTSNCLVVSFLSIAVSNKMYCFMPSSRSIFSFPMNANWKIDSTKMTFARDDFLRVFLGYRRSILLLANFILPQYTMDWTLRLLRGFCFYWIQMNILSLKLDCSWDLPFVWFEFLVFNWAAFVTTESKTF